MKECPTYFEILWQQFKKNSIGKIAACVLLFFILIGIYAPLLASSKPIIVVYNAKFYFPLFRYLFYSGFYTKRIDIFYNLLMFTFPLAFIGNRIFYKRKKHFLFSLLAAHFLLFTIFSFGTVKNPAGSPQLSKKREEIRQKNTESLPLTAISSWNFDLKYLSSYDKLNTLLRYKQRKKEHEKLKDIAKIYELETGKKMPTLYVTDQTNFALDLERMEKNIEKNEKEALAAKQQLSTLTANYIPFSVSLLLAQKEVESAKNALHILRTIHAGPESIENAEKQITEAESELKKINEQANKANEELIKAKTAIKKWENGKAKKAYLLERQKWIEEETKKITFVIPALVRPYHWEDDAGGQQSINKYIPWWHLTRINRKDLVSALIFGVRISLVVGICSVVISLLIAIPLGMVAGYFAGKTDMGIFRFIEIWEAMPTFFMLLLVVAITQSKSIFIVVAVLGLFGWTSFARFIRGETLKQRNLPYVMAAKSLGFSHSHIMFSQILPNAIPPILTLLPFSIMAAITSEAGLSFLGLGEEGSTSWGVLMDEGRSVFPGESYLLWPPAILLTVLLISIALVGDALRDAIDPKTR